LRAASANCWQQRSTRSTALPPLPRARYLDRISFDAVHRNLGGRSIAFGSTPFDRKSGPLAKSQGARGMADAWYFYAPDGHNIEVRCYKPGH